MEKTSSALMAAILILVGNRSSATRFFPFAGIIISFCIVLQYSLLWCLLQTTLDFLIIATMKGYNRADDQGEEKNTNAGGVPIPSQPCSDHARLDDKLFRAEVEVVMEKLGFSCDPNGDELQERLGSDEKAALVGEELSLEDVKEAFEVFDENSDGFIVANELEKVLCALGFQEISEMECHRMISAFDDNGDGRIDFGEFKKLLENSSC